MKTFTCTCGQLLFFENVKCVQCSRELGFLPDLLCLTSLDPQKDGTYRSTTKEMAGNGYRKCKNYTADSVCNWMIPQNSKADFCVSCRLDETIPDLSINKNRDLWKLVEAAKRRLVYTLLSLRLPILNRQDDPKQGLAFRFLADGPTPDTMVLTGHDEGLITLNIVEADDAEREKRRISMKEPYRTLLGHFRHEIGHYYWDRLIANTKYIEPFRAVFGDERPDYNEALKKYYARTPDPNWQNNFISVYATAHPWEDWAETWAHYLHIQDTLEVALQFGLVDRRVVLDAKEPRSWFFSSKEKSFEEKIEAWSDLTIALNSINRSMGLHDIYPFVLSDPVVQKLRFISDVIAGRDISKPAPVPKAAPSASQPAPAGPVNNTVEPGPQDKPAAVPKV